MSRNVSVVSIDTNILIKLTALQTGNKQEISFMTQHGELESLEQFLFLMQHQKVRPIITPIVLSEVLQGIEKHGTDIIDFIKNNNIFVVDLNEKQQTTFFSESAKLANRYCRPVTNKEKIAIVKKPQHLKACPKELFHSYYDKEIHRRITNNDSLVMAQSTVLGTALITNDLKDFIANGRPQLIGYINETQGYKEESRPYSNNAFIQKYGQHFKFPALNSNFQNRIIKAQKVDLGIEM